MGAAFGTSKAGIGIAGLGGFKPELIMKVRLFPSIRRVWYASSVMDMLGRCYVVFAELPSILKCFRQSLIPVVMSGIIAVYGLVVSVLISGNGPSLPSITYVRLTYWGNTVRATDYSLAAGFIHLAAGLACGMTGIAAGYAIGIVGDAVCSPRVLVNGLLLLTGFVASAYARMCTSRGCSCLWCSS